MTPIYAHLGHALEPLAFAPAVAVVLVAFVRDRRARPAAPGEHGERIDAPSQPGDAHPRLIQVEDSPDGHSRNHPHR
jgi:hypothetical protein